MITWARAEEEYIFSAGFECGQRPWSAYTNPPDNNCSHITMEQAGLSEVQLQEFVHEAVSANPNALDESEFWPLAESVASKIGCQLQEPCAQAAHSPHPIVTAALSTCQKTYCRDVLYCGPGDSETNPVPTLTKWASDTLNHICFDHDRCYDNVCQSGLLCTWSKQNGADNCDSNFFSAATLSNSSLLTDAIIVQLAREFKAIHTATPGICGMQAPCAGLCVASEETGHICIGSGSTSCSGNSDCPSAAVCDGTPGRCVPWNAAADNSASCWLCAGGTNAYGQTLPPRVHIAVNCSVLTASSRNDSCVADWSNQSAYGCATGAGICSCDPCSAYAGSNNYYFQQYHP
jgi:hypothetical protein